jgi:uncharacterized protein YbbC (DUF1343 family)
MNQASVDREFRLAHELLHARFPGRLAALFSPQHGLFAEQQDNMVESGHGREPRTGAPLFSLYSETRRPRREWLEGLDLLVVDLQDVGCRVYTFITTLRYVLEACARNRKAVWVLDRPNPVGRPVEGTRLKAGWESFVGAGSLPMRHGLTMGELARWFKHTLRLDVELEVIAMEGWQPAQAPGFGWPLGERAWVNPSPNAPTLAMTRCYAGTVMLEGTTLSEGRGTTRPLEVLGAPDIDARELVATMTGLAPQWLAGCALRECWFEPTFHKHAGKLCGGFQIHAEAPIYAHDAFRPWRLVAAAFKAVRRLRPDYPLWRDFAYEYERDRLAIDLINGGETLRRWVDDAAAKPGDLDAAAAPDEKSWLAERDSFLIYR